MIVVEIQVQVELEVQVVVMIPVLVLGSSNNGGRSTASGATTSSITTNFTIGGGRWQHGKILRSYPKMWLFIFFLDLYINTHMYVIILA